MDLAALNALPADAARAELTRCCGAARWVEGMVKSRPYADKAALHRSAEEQWRALGREDILEAFAHHPRIGASAAAGWAKGEQAGVSGAAQETLQAIADGNREYERRFGHIYLVCATGKAAPELLAILERRLKNEPDAELAEAAAEQAKITALRLEKLLS
ncbi:MAG: 2-oxo-4-hydroxy-4-carboxy-5-ureidoimidazoline decarboxylase [Elusimicrobia bacterium]|nr:2-oxo-4-hydroxy-4-carboxy-5-ureidoimidazoline decarboxylase [Elusimicrobiota bacterium]